MLGGIFPLSLSLTTGRNKREHLLLARFHFNLILTIEVGAYLSVTTTRCPSLLVSWQAPALFADFRRIPQAPPPTHTQTSALAYFRQNASAQG